MRREYAGRLGRAVVAWTVLAVLAGCGSTSTSKPIDDKPSPSARESACVEVRTGIAAYNTKHFKEVQPSFVKAKVFAERYVKSSTDTAADKLLEAIIFFAEVPPDSYTKDAKTLKLFEKYKAITLGDCENDDEPAQSV